MFELPRGQHYTFAHQVLPRLFHADPGRFIASLSSGGDDLLHSLWDDVGKHVDQSELVAPEGLGHQIRKIQKWNNNCFDRAAGPQRAQQRHTLPRLYIALRKRGCSPDKGPLLVSSHWSVASTWRTRAQGLCCVSGPPAIFTATWASGPEPTLEAFFATVCNMIAR